MAKNLQAGTTIYLRVRMISSFHQHIGGENKMSKLFNILAIAVCLFGLAAGIDDTSTVSATVNAKITISDVADVGLGAFDPGTTATSGNMPVTVQSNKNWQVDVSAAGTGLSTAMQIKNEAAAFVDLDFTDPRTPTLFYDDIKPGASFNTAVQQAATYSDDPALYTVTLTFAATQP